MKDEATDYAIHYIHQHYTYELKSYPISDERNTYQKPIINEPYC